MKKNQRKDYQSPVLMETVADCSGLICASVVIIDTADTEGFTEDEVHGW